MGQKPFMDYALLRVRSKKERKRFVELPRQFFQGRPEFVPPLAFEAMKRLDPARNPFFEHAETGLWLCIAHDSAGERAVGRISASVDQLALDWNKDQAGVFGHFLAEDEEAAKLLFAEAESFLKERGIVRMTGPIELSTNYSCGQQVSAFDAVPLMEMNQQPQGQEALLLAQGLSPIKDLVTFRRDASRAKIDRFDRIGKICQKRNKTKIRSIDPKNFAAEVENFYTIYEAAWEKNFGFVPMTRKEFRVSAKDFRKIYIPKLCLVAELDDKPVGWLLVLPDVNHGILACNGRLLPFGFIKFLLAMRKKKQVRTRLLTLGILPEARGRGLDALLIAEITRRVSKHGSPMTELGWVLEDNTPILNAAAEIGAAEAMRYRLYGKDI